MKQAFPDCHLVLGQGLGFRVDGYGSCGRKKPAAQGVWGSVRGYVFGFSGLSVSGNTVLFLDVRHCS